MTSPSTAALTQKAMETVADLIQGRNNIVLMVGAGISTSAGIPDFRTPGSGLYANLARLSLPYPEAVFSLDFFRRNPLPFYTLAKELYPGRHRPTISHSFIRLLEMHSSLSMCFTQNIDTLERRAGVPADKLIEAHGSFEGQRCIECEAPYPLEKMRAFIQTGDIPTCGKCRGFVKPDIVFFGESMPDSFFSGLPKLRTADLLIVMGTSLTVNPFASLTHYVSTDCPRVLINMENVGNFDKPTDVVLLGKCDDVVRDLCKYLGWEDELLAEWAITADSLDEHPLDVNPSSRPSPRVLSPEEEKADDVLRSPRLVDLLDEITANVARMALPEPQDDPLQSSPNVVANIYSEVTEPVVAVELETCVDPEIRHADATTTALKVDAAGSPEKDILEPKTLPEEPRTSFPKENTLEKPEASS